MTQKIPIPADMTKGMGYLTIAKVVDGYPM